MTTLQAEIALHVISVLAAVLLAVPLTCLVIWYAHKRPMRLVDVAIGATGIIVVILGAYALFWRVFTSGSAAP